MALAGERGRAGPARGRRRGRPRHGWAAPFSLVAFAAGEAPNVWSARRMLRLTEEAARRRVLDDVAGPRARDPARAVEAATAEPPRILGMRRRRLRGPCRRRALGGAARRHQPAAPGARRRRPLARGERAADRRGRLPAPRLPPRQPALRRRAARALAVLDWEFSGAGDPLCDIGYAAQPYALGKLLRAAPSLDLPPRSDRLAAGRVRRRAPDAVDPERQRWFVALGIFKMAVALVLSADRWWRGARRPARRVAGAADPVAHRGPRRRDPERRRSSRRRPAPRRCDADDLERARRAADAGALARPRAPVGTTIPLGGAGSGRRRRASTSSWRARRRRAREAG